MKQLFFIISFTLFSIYIQAQTFSIRGTVLDENNLPIEAATCVIQDDRNSSVEALITDTLGQFEFQSIQAGQYRLILQHLSFERDTIALTVDKNIDIPSIVLFSKGLELSGVVIQGERPLVKSKDGKLIYNASLLIKDRIVGNAFEALKVVPNIIGGDENISLVGADEYTIAINGQATSLNKEQLINILKNTPASKVRDIEIMYSAPPQYNVRGALINVVIAEQDTEISKSQGEVYTSYNQATHASYDARTNLSFNKPSYSLDLTLGAEIWKIKSKNKMHAMHILDDDQYDIFQNNKSKPNGTDINARVVFDYRLKNKDKISFSYIGEYNTYRSKHISNASYKKKGEKFENINSYNDSEGNDQLHNIRLDYSSHYKLKLGVDYTFFRDPGTQKYNDYENSTLLTEYKTKTKQQVDKATFYANHQLALDRGWNLDYGVNFNLSGNDNDYNYFSSFESSVSDSISLTKQKEYSMTAYSGFSKSFGEKFSIQASLSGNYFKASIKNKEGETKILWDKFKPFFNANLSYTFSDKHILRYSFSSDVKYPPYWALSPDAIQLNAYSIVRGNPELKFSESYISQLIYTFKNKYILIGSYKHDTNYFTQLPYQSEDELKNVFQVENLDYRKTASLSVILPFGISNILDSKTTFSYTYTKEKDSDFLDLPYLRSKNTISVSFNGAINISSKPNIKMDISAFYMNGYIQGVYDIHHMHSIDAGIKWTFCDNKGELSAKAVDIFNGLNAKTSVNIYNQWSTMTKYSDTPAFKVSFIYKFGGYKKKNIISVDKSRLGRGN